jgi:AraC-like DNA-binding protein
LKTGQNSFETGQMSGDAFDMAGALSDLPLTALIRQGKSARAPLHTHPQGQLIYPELGGLVLETGGSIVRLAPDRAAWIPGGVSHSVLIDRTYRYHSVYFVPEFVAADDFFVLNVRPLLRELIFEVARWAADSDREQRMRLSSVLMDELKRAQRRSPGIEIPNDARIARICREIEKDPSGNKSLPAWAREVGASEKTIQRLFATSTGMSFQQWRSRVRMTKAMEYHAQGLRLIDVAVAVGYATEGAYAQAFKKHFGYPPSRLQMAEPSG